VQRNVKAFRLVTMDERDDGPSSIVYRLSSIVYRPSSDLRESVRATWCALRSNLLSALDIRRESE
jgi:hypothetical protein